MAATRDLKSLALIKREGSTPSPSTNLKGKCDAICETT